MKISWRIFTCTARLYFSMSIVDDSCFQDKGYGKKLLPNLSPSSSNSINFHSPVTTVNVQANRKARHSYIHQYHAKDCDAADNCRDIDNDKQSCHHYLLIGQNPINILLKIAAAVVLLSIAGCLVLQHLRISQLDYRIRRIEYSSAYSIKVRKSFLSLT